MLDPYIGILILTLVGVLNAGAMMGVSHLVGSNRPTAVKASPYESGITPLGTTRERFSVNFYLVAMLFIVLDIETLFLIPWAAVFREFGIVGFLEITAFLLVLGVGLVYAWKKGALEWD
ncbi:MAG: NADH-quinone oxidoreductase subunit A [Gemmatimonadetes bacterium]|nr:NADH-quinone oxidoreductase subunit A [Gemmatimonadota bacterium]